MKYAHVYALLLMSALCISCEGQNKKTPLSKQNIQSETKDVVTSPGSNEGKYEYTDSMGKRLIIQNSFPKGGLKYKYPDGKGYVYAVFWTRIINETDNPLELKIDFPVESYELPSIPGHYFRLFFPPDTMTIDKEPLSDYGLRGLKSFLDNAFYKPSSLKMTISPKESSAFYVVTLSEQGVTGPIRTGFTFKDQNVFYSINKNEIHCGKINLKNLMLQK
ncbi:hypothetical protein [Flavobacterium undicola]|uniref:hypothetical protein n=1 Tax=Flavobacterium undicola TaxID=1932779 RepID=UPI001377FFC3|nr:hypothetical protein [Flavobacterium undicola]MBA0883473.1 hypothetical protein [Flavobacterium undicola]